MIKGLHPSSKKTRIRIFRGALLGVYSYPLFKTASFRQKVYCSMQFLCMCLCLFVYEWAFSSLQAIRVFFMLRSLSLQLQGEPETQLPLTRPEDLIKTDDVLDLSKTHTETQRHTHCTLCNTRPQATAAVQIYFHAYNRIKE